MILHRAGDSGAPSGRLCRAVYAFSQALWDRARKVLTRISIFLAD